MVLTCDEDNTHQLFNCTHIVTPGSMDRPRQSYGTAEQMDGEAGWWTTTGRLKSHLARIKGVGKQQHG